MISYAKEIYVWLIHSCFILFRFFYRGALDLLKPIDRFVGLTSYLLHQRVAALRTKAKLLSILTGLFSNLVVKVRKLNHRVQI
jgi:hypothetical protein